MNSAYYQPADLKKFANIGEFQKPLADKFFDYHGEASLVHGVQMMNRTKELSM